MLTHTERRLCWPELVWAFQTVPSRVAAEELAGRVRSSGASAGRPVVQRPRSIVVVDMPDRRDPGELALSSFAAVLRTTLQVNAGRSVSRGAGWHTQRRPEPSERIGIAAKTGLASSTLEVVWAETPIVKRLGKRWWVCQTLLTTGPLSEPELRCPECDAQYTTGSLFCPQDGSRLVHFESEADPTDSTVISIPADEFKVEDELGVGGMGEVFKAWAVRFDCWVALKLLRGGAVEDERARRRFHLEMQIIGQLQHPHTVRLITFGEFDTRSPYMAMEYIEGESLEILIARGPIQWERAIRIVDKVCQCLEEAHALGIVHRDIKPGNVMFERRLDGVADYVKVLDFGLAKVECETSDLTSSGMVVGTPSYLAPEQARGESANHYVDIYSLGVMFFEMLTGERPFRAPNVPVLIFKHVYEPPPRIAERYPHIELPVALENLVQRMLAKDACERPASMTEVRHELAFALTQPTPETAVRPMVTADFANSFDEKATLTRRAIDPVMVTSMNLGETGDMRVWVPKNLIGDTADSQKVPAFDPSRDTRVDLPVVGQRRTLWLLTAATVLLGGLGLALWWII